MTDEHFSNSEGSNDRGGEMEPETIQSEPSSLDQERPGSMIGRYKILQEIGQGGFGAVYEAEQKEPVRRRVALKIIKLGMDTREVIARFEAERQALAMMDHPNIARVLDAGATQTGRPYFVMELVRGVPITEYCDKENLSTRDRLKLFATVCRAVQHAHQKGIIHRDLKPSNVMVAIHDGKPVPKVIDFGIAKAMNRDLTDKTLVTEYRRFIGTPEYMSPEQAEMSGLDIDTRSDIYSLGVLLYQLLTGTTPFDPARLRKATFGEVQRIIREEEPHRPSTRLTTMGDRLQDVARRQCTDCKHLVSTLRSDLDWIVMKALEKDRTRRYETANGLALDIERHLRDEAVLAGPPAPMYRLGKFARRNRAVFFTSGVVAAALLFAIAALVYGFIEVKRERDHTAELKVTSQADILLRTMNSVRAYTTNHVKPQLYPYLDDSPTFFREVVPGFSAREVFEDFRSDDDYRQFFYKEATLDPVNPRDQADEFEVELVNRFITNPELTEEREYRDASEGKLFYVARPIRVGDQSCLECHAKPEDAPPSMIEMYGADGGFNWKLNEIVGAQIVYVPASHLFKDTGPKPAPIVLYASIGVAIFAFVPLIYFAIRPPYSSKQ